MEDSSQPSKRRRYDAAFHAEVLRLARESRSAQAAVRALNIRPELLYQWQRAAQAPLPADPAAAAEVRALRTTNKRLTQEPDILKKAIAICQMPEAHFCIP